MHDAQKSKIKNLADDISLNSIREQGWRNEAILSLSLCVEMKMASMHLRIDLIKTTKKRILLSVNTRLCTI